MNPRKLLYAAAFLGFADSAANALTVKELADQCAELFATSGKTRSPQSVVNGTGCLGYFLGFVGGFDAASAGLGATMKAAGRPIDRKTAEKMLVLCVPNNSVTATTMASVFLDWVKRNPTHHNDIAQYGVFTALLAVYPCR